MVTRTVVQSAMHTAAMALVNLPQDEWASWVAYLCQALEESAQAHGDPDDIETMIQQIRALLDERLSQGHW